MKIITDRPDGLLSNNDFILMGLINDSDKDYACLLQLSTGNLFIEEIHWGMGKNIETATVHQVENDIEWVKMFEFVSKSTTIFSPKKIKTILGKGIYFYRSEYLEKNIAQEDKKL